MELEYWKPLWKPHHRYQVSNYGRVRYWNNTPRKLEISGDLTKRKGIVTATIRDITQWGKSIKINIPRAVYKLFVGKIKGGLEVTHKDGQFKNNYYKNLILWDDKFINYNAYIHWLNDFIPPIPKSKIQKTVKEKILKEYIPYKMSKRKLWIKYNLSETSIFRIINKHIA